MILDEIVAAKKAELTTQRRAEPLAQLRERVEHMTAARDFEGALQQMNVALIAEIKRASPSRGTLRADCDPAQLARVYAEGGAAAISVLTNAAYFRGSLEDLHSVHGAVHRPLLCKEFIVDEFQIYEVRAAGADALLLIVRILSDAQLRDYALLAASLGMSVLTEVHDEGELERAARAGARIIGINNRNLADFTVELATTERLAPRIPHECIVVAESGISSRADVERVARAGCRAVLVGEALVRAKNVAGKVAELAGVRARRER